MLSRRHQSIEATGRLKHSKLPADNSVANANSLLWSVCWLHGNVCRFSEVAEYINAHKWFVAALTDRWNP